MAFLLQLFLQFEIVLDNPVVHHHILARAIPVRVRVCFCWASVRSPSRMPDAVGSVDWGRRHSLFQIAQFSGRPAQLQLAVRSDHGYTSGVVPAVFQLPQPLNNHRHNFFRTDIADNSAHAASLLTLKKSE